MIAMSRVLCHGPLSFLALVSTMALASDTAHAHDMRATANINGLVLHGCDSKSKKNICSVFFWQQDKKVTRANRPKGLRDNHFFFRAEEMEPRAWRPVEGRATTPKNTEGAGKGTRSGCPAHGSPLMVSSHRRWPVCRPDGDERRNGMMTPWRVPWARWRSRAPVVGSHGSPAKNAADNFTPTPKAIFFSFLVGAGGAVGKRCMLDSAVVAVT